MNLADEATLRDLEFAWRALRAPKSNAIMLADNGAAVGIGMGQVNRVDSCKLSVERANTLGGEGHERARGAVAASDAFFPFADACRFFSTPVSVRSCTPAARSVMTKSFRPRRMRVSPCT